MHRTVLIVLLSFGVAGTGFLTTTVSSLQQHLTSDIPLTNQLQSFQLIPQFCGEAIALIVWYFVYRRRDDRPLPPSATAPPPNAAFDNSFRPIPLSASTIVDGRPVLTSPDSSAEPLLTPNSAGAAVDSKSAAPPVAGTAPAQPLRVRTYKGTGTGVGLAWYELVFWAFVFAAMDGIATIAWGRDWIPNPTDSSLRTVYLIATPLVSRVVLRHTISWPAIGCVAMSCAGYLLVGLGAGSRGCASRDDLNFSGGDTGLIDASVETICAVGIINDMIFHFGFTALQTVLEERLMRRHYMHPVFLIGIEGVAGLIMASALFGAGAVGAHSFYFTHHMNQINQFFTQPLWWLTSIAFMFCILGFNMSLMFVTYYGSATLRTFVESSRLALAWSGDVLTRNAPVAWYLPPGFVLVLGGSLLYFWVTEHERLIRRAVSEPQPSDSAQVVVSVPSPAALIPTSGDDGKTDLPMESLGPDSNDVAVSRVVVSSTRIDVTPATDATAAVGVDPSDDSTPHPFAVGVVVVGSTAYFIYLHVLAHATGAMSTVDMAGSILMMFVVTAVFVARSNPCRVDRHSHDAGAAAKAEESTSPLLPSAALTSLNGGGSSVPSPPPSLPLVSISGNVAWSHTLSYRLITITVYWSTWAVFVPIFALLINQTLFADPNPLNTTAYSANFVTNVLRSFSAVVLGWCLLPLRSITVAYGRREVLTRIVLDLVDAFNLVDPSVIISPREHGGAGLNPNDFIDSILLGASVLFAGLTLLLIAVIGAASGLQDTSTPVMTSSPAAAAVAVAGGSAGGGAGPDPQRSRYKRDDQNDVRLFWVLVPYVASIVVNNTPFLILRIIIWVHTDYLSVALLAKNVLGVLLCAFFIGSTWIQHKQLLLQHPQPPQLQPSR